MKTHCVRLLPNEDLKKRIAQICSEQKITAACIVSAVGSLKQLKLRLANSKSYLESQENFEILSLNGTIGVDGIHLHMTASDQFGKVIGGHLLDDNLIYTTCELVLIEIANTQFQRKFDDATGFNEILFNKV